MTAEEFLNRPRLMEKRIRHMTEELEELKAAALRCTPAYGGEMVCHSRRTDGLERIVYRIHNAEQALKEDVGILRKVREEIDAVISKLNDENTKKVIRMLFLEGKTKKDIAECLGLSRMTVYRKRIDGMSQINSILEESEHGEV